MAVELIREVAREFTLDFVANPYLCYTEHGQHALFYAMLYNALPREQRTARWRCSGNCPG